MSWFQIGLEPPIRIDFAMSFLHVLLFLARFEKIDAADGATALLQQRLSPFFVLEPFRVDRRCVEKGFLVIVMLTSMIVGCRCCPEEDGTGSATVDLKDSLVSGALFACNNDWKLLSMEMERELGVNLVDGTATK